MDGTVAAYRFPYLLAGNSVVLKQESPYYEHFYIDLKPWVHYVPIQRNLQDVEDVIRHLKVGLMYFCLMVNFESVITLCNDVCDDSSCTPHATSTSAVHPRSAHLISHHTRVYQYAKHSICHTRQEFGGQF